MSQYINGCELSEITPSIKNILNENIFFGPTNFAYLKGTINGITKNIWITCKINTILIIDKLMFHLCHYFIFLTIFFGFISSDS